MHRKHPFLNVMAIYSSDQTSTNFKLNTHRVRVSFKYFDEADDFYEDLLNMQSQLDGQHFEIVHPMASHYVDLELKYRAHIAGMRSNSIIQELSKWFDLPPTITVIYPSKEVEKAHLIPMQKYIEKSIPLEDVNLLVLSKSEFVASLLLRELRMKLVNAGVLSISITSSNKENHAQITRCISLIFDTAVNRSVFKEKLAYLSQDYRFASEFKFNSGFTSAATVNRLICPLYLKLTTPSKVDDFLDHLLAVADRLSPSSLPQARPSLDSRHMCFN